MAKQRNWEKIKTEYITGNLSFRKTAEKFGVPFQTLAQRASREHWYQDKVVSKNNVVTRPRSNIVTFCAADEKSPRGIAVRSPQRSNRPN